MSKPLFILNGTELQLINNSESEDELLRLLIGIALLQAFIQANWTGPDIDIDLHDIISLSSEQEVMLHSKAIAELAKNGEPAYHLAHFPAFLSLARIIFQETSFVQCKSALWWRLRTHLIHQQVLDEPVPLSPSEIDSFLALETSHADENSDIRGRLLVDLGRMFHFSSQDKIAAEYLTKAAEATGLEYELTGALGKRTKFQTESHSQLVLLAKSKLSAEDIIASSSLSSSSIPSNLPLNDDTLLESTQFTSPSVKGADPLHPLDQTILLSLSQILTSTSPSNALTSEQVAPYIALILSHPQNWSIHTMALLLRSRIESNRTRTVERATLQLQALVDQMPTLDSKVEERLQWIHELWMPSKWDLERELAKRFFTLGILRSALEIFERLEMWEDVVNCYVSLEQPEKGIEIVTDLLEGRKIESATVVSRAKSNSPSSLDKIREAKLWCILGDLTTLPSLKESHYTRAWTLSSQTSARAIRSLGFLSFSLSSYPSAISSLKIAVKINPLVFKAWFILGCAAMKEEDWETAREAFARCTRIDEDDGESWSNLASVYLRMAGEVTTAHGKEEDGRNSGDDVDETEDEPSPQETALKLRTLAFHALKQGLKYAYENWRMWSNYTLVALEIGDLRECLRGLTRVVEETQGKVLDEDVVDRLVDSVTRFPPPEAEERVTNSSLLPALVNLFEKNLLSKVSPSPRIYRAYARLLTYQNRWGDATRAYLDAYRASPSSSLNAAQKEEFEEATREVEDILDILLNFGPKVEEEVGAGDAGTKVNWKLQGRSIIRSFLGRMKDFEDEEGFEKLKERLEEFS